MLPSWIYVLVLASVLVSIASLAVTTCHSSLLKSARGQISNLQITLFETREHNTALLEALADKQYEDYEWCPRTTEDEANELAAYDLFNQQRSEPCLKAV